MIPKRFSLLSFAFKNLRKAVSSTVIEKAAGHLQPICLELQAAKRVSSEDRDLLSEKKKIKVS